MEINAHPNNQSLGVSTTDPKHDWSYVSEGGASIVFSYIGPSNPFFDGTVLRLRKSPRQDALLLKKHISSTPPVLHDTDTDDPDDPSIAFQDVVTSKLIPSAHLPQLQAVKVSRPWLQELSDIAETQRPTERAIKDGIDTSRSKAALATDLVGGKSWAVEIKPKWGFLPSPTHLSPSTSPLKMRHCRFCMHRHLKTKKEGLAASGYCPLDLFSGDTVRVRKAVESLWHMWLESRGKANNLRIFVEGTLLDPAESTSFSRLAAQFPGSRVDHTSLEDLLSLFTDALLPLLIDTPVLPILSHLQRTLDPLDIEGLSCLWSYSHPGVPIGLDEPDPSLMEWSAFVNAYISEPIDGNLRQSILAYLLSATFKDCSIILGLEHATEGILGRKRGTITVIDLDPKSVSRLAQWEALDQEIVKSFERVAAEQPVCVDARAH